MSKFSVRWGKSPWKWSVERGGCGLRKNALAIGGTGLGQFSRSDLNSKKRRRRVCFVPTEIQRRNPLIYRFIKYPSTRGSCSIAQCYLVLTCKTDDLKKKTIYNAPFKSHRRCKILYCHPSRASAPTFRPPRRREGG